MIKWVKISIVWATALINQARGGRMFNILVVEDKRDLRELFCDVLKEKGLHLGTFELWFPCKFARPP